MGRPSCRINPSAITNGMKTILSTRPATKRALKVWYLNVVFISLSNVKVMATPLAGASVERGIEVVITGKHREQRG